MRAHPLELASVPSAVGWARRHTADVLVTWGVAELVETATLLVSELVTNAIRHETPDPNRIRESGTGPAVDRTGDPGWAQVYRVAVVLRLLPGAVVLEVFDPDPHPPVLKEQSPEAEGGRGLFLVDMLSTRWSYSRLPEGGKVVWCQLQIPEDVPAGKKS